MKGPAHDQCKAVAAGYGYRVVRIEEWETPASEFKAARIVGPGLPAHGLPFCVPALEAEIWADRVTFGLAMAHQAGEMSEMIARKRKVQ